MIEMEIDYDFVKKAIIEQLRKLMPNLKEEQVELEYTYDKSKPFIVKIGEGNN